MSERLITLNVYYEAPDCGCEETYYWRHEEQYSLKELGTVLYNLIDNCIYFTIG